MRRFRVRGAGSNGLNLRAEPGLGSQVLGVLEDGDDVLAEDATEQASRRSWRRIVQPRVGYVADAFLDPLQDATSVDPPAAPA